MQFSKDRPELCQFTCHIGRIHLVKIVQFLDVCILNVWLVRQQESGRKELHLAQNINSHVRKYVSELTLNTH